MVIENEQTILALCISHNLKLNSYGSGFDGRLESSPRC
jgi:hypothetical protein